MSAPKYRRIMEHYEQRLAEHGATAKGMDWPNEADLRTRFAVMLGLTEKATAPVDLLDLGCGVGLLCDYLRQEGIAPRYRYQGVDLSAKMVDAARQRHPGEKFEVRDVLEQPLPAQSVDYVVMNGLLTERVGLDQEGMERFAQAMVESAYAACRRGIAFNVMSTHVDWTREDLFHWPFDRVAAFLKEKCTRHVVIRADYGLYEYTVYAYREPRR